MKHPFVSFLSDFIPMLERKATQLNKAFWILETTGSQDAADLKAELDTEVKMLFNDPITYEKLLKWEKEGSVTDPILKRQLNVLIRSFKQNMVPKELLEEISKKEAELSQSYANFRPKFEGKALSENDIKKLLKTEENPEKRKKVWEASKEIGDVLAPQILNLVHLRNKAAKSLGYSDYFQMQLELQEVNREKLLAILDNLSKGSSAAYQKMIDEIDDAQIKRFGVKKEELGPWAWSDPFCQEDPLGARDLDELVASLNFTEAGIKFYRDMGIDVQPVLARSDMYEREGKSQHAFCINIDRKGDVRNLNNVQPSIRWFETVLHELGHAIYEIGYGDDLPWLLREPPHMITTEAMALLAGRQAYHISPLAKESLKRRQLIFSRWVLVMTFFESELYRDPAQDLNALWWQLVEKYQKVRPPKSREKKNDWAAKYHIGLAPVYYFSYLLGEMLASMLEESIGNITSEKAGRFLNEKVFKPGNSLRWDKLIEHATGAELKPDAWLRQFAK